MYIDVHIVLIVIQYSESGFNVWPMDYVFKKIIPEIKYKMADMSRAH